jgi:predicted HD phosphohydrolase
LLKGRGAPHRHRWRSAGTGPFGEVVISGDTMSPLRNSEQEIVMETVAFTSMADGTRADYQLLERLQQRSMATLPDRVLTALEALRDSLAGYQVSRYEHSLQSATRALRDGRDEEYIIAALLHDLGDELAPYTHGELVGAILRPFVRPELVWVVKHHGVFQLHYYGHHIGVDRDARERFRGHEWFDACAEFCDLYDQTCFDPSYDSLTVSDFEPMLRRVFAEPRYLTGAEAI